MFGNSHFDRLQKAFEDQFSADGSRGFIYRKNQKGAPVRISEFERSDYIAKFSKRMRYVMWLIFPSTVILILLLAWLVPHANSTMAGVAVWVGLGAILAPFVAILYWAWNAPARALQTRLPEGAALTKEEARALASPKSPTAD